MSKKRAQRKKKPNPERGKETETRILDAGEIVFARVGFAGASTQEIAATAGVTKAMIHYYFDSKEQLYRAVLDRILFELIRLVQETTVDTDDDPVEEVITFVDGFVDYVARHPHFGRLTYMGSGSEGRYFDSIVTTFFRPLFDRGVNFVNEGIKAGLFRKIDVPQFLLSVYNIAMGYFADAHFITVMMEEDAMSEERIRACRVTVRDMVLRYLLVEPPSDPQA